MSKKGTSRRGFLKGLFGAAAVAATAPAVKEILDKAENLDAPSVAPVKEVAKETAKKVTKRTGIVAINGDVAVTVDGEGKLHSVDGRVVEDWSGNKTAELLTFDEAELPSASKFPVGYGAILDHYDDKNVARQVLVVSNGKEWIGVGSTQDPSWPQG
jgi:hypothetical protein